MKSHHRCENRFKLAGLAVLVFTLVQVASGTALDDYVAAPDANCSYSLVNTIVEADYTAYVLDMTSQAWRSKDEVDRTLWKHWLTIIKPDEVVSDKALLLITGGSNGRPAPSKPDSMVTGITLKSKTVVAELRMVPNEPLVFPDGGGARTEDGIIAYTFNKYMETGDSTWPPSARSSSLAWNRRKLQTHVYGAYRWLPTRYGCEPCPSPARHF